MLSGLLSGIISEAVYYLAYILPFLGVIVFAGREKGEKNLFRLNKRCVGLFLPTVFPTVASVILISSAVSALIFIISGKSSSVDIGDNIAVALVLHAAVPAALEELLFRYLPIRYISHYSRGYAVAFSSLMFALVHHSFFSIPYALFAGVVFMTVDLLCDSIWPSIIIHFVNNAVSVIWTICFSTAEGGRAVVLTVCLLGALSLAVMIFKRREYIVGVKKIFAEKVELIFAPEMLGVIVSAAILAIYELTVI